MSQKRWAPRASHKGYVTTYSSIANRSPAELEARLGFSAGSLQRGYAVYQLDGPVALNEFEWRDTTQFSGGWHADPSIEFGSEPEDKYRIWSVQRRDELRAELGRELGYDEKKVDAEIDKVLRASLKRLNVRHGDERIVKLIAAGQVSGYPDSPYTGIPQWELKAKKWFKLIDVAVAPEIAKRLSGATWWHANQAKYANSSAVSDLAPGFSENVEKFIAALERAGAVVRPSATRRNKVRAHLMHYCYRLAKGQIKAAAIPEIDGCDIVWDHGLEAKSRKAAKEMVGLFDIVYQPSLTSLHIQGKAIDMTISWAGTITIKDGKGRDVQVGGPQNGAKNTVLHRIGASYGVHKLLSDAPHWSVNGH